MRRLRRVFTASTLAFALAPSAHAAVPARIVAVDASPAIDRGLAALRVTLAEDVSWGTEPCAPPRTGAICAKPPPPRAGTVVTLAGGREASAVTGDAHHVPTAWLVVVDAGAPIAPRWQDVRTAAFAWLDAVPREGDRVAVVMLGETHHVSRTPWFSYEQRARATEALGFQSLPLMPLGRDEALGPVFDAAVAEALRDLPTLPTGDDVPRVVVGLFADGRTRTAQAALDEKTRAGRTPSKPLATRSRSFEVEAFWFPHDLADPRADGSGGMLHVTRERGHVTRFDGAPREAAVREAARRAQAPADRATTILIEAPNRNLFPEVPAVELHDDRGALVDATGPIAMPLEREAWPLPRVVVALDDLPNLALVPPLASGGEQDHRWRAFWLPIAEAPAIFPASGASVTRASIEGLVATDRELTLAPSGGLFRARLDSAAMLERASGPLAVVVYDDVTGRATPMRLTEAPVIPQGTWTAPLVDGLRALRLGLLCAALAALSTLARVRKRRASSG
jgi:hypothetical protein